MNLTGKVVVITGASAGVGRAVAHAFADQNAKVALIARSSAGLTETLAEVEKRRGVGLALPVDVSDYEALSRASDRVEQELGPIDIWVNNAMASVFGRVLDAKPEEIARVTDVTYLGAVYGTLCALKKMRPRGAGKIVQVGSALAYRGIPLQAAYCGAKHALQGFTESLRCELMHDRVNIGVTMVQLPALNTPQFDWVKSRLQGRAQPVPPIYQPEVAAQGIVWAAAHDRRELMVGAPTVKAIVGNKLMPGVGDWYLANHGVGSQQTSEPEDPHRPHNLWSSVTGLHATHGRFDERAKAYSVQLWITTHRPLFAALLVLTFAAIILLYRSLGANA